MRASKNIWQATREILFTGLFIVVLSALRAG
jgi:hypothetical protein